MAAAVTDIPGEAGPSLSLVGGEGPAFVRALEQVEEVAQGRADSSLRRRLVLTDLTMAVAAWLLVTLGPWSADAHWVEWLVSAALAVMLTLVLIAAGGLYRARVASVHSAEASRLGAVSVAVGLAYALFAPSTAGSGAGAATAAGVLFLALLSGRSVYRNWLLAQRATGKRLRAVVMIGADDEAYRMADHLAERPQIGYQVVGYLRSAGAPEQGRRPVLGVAQDAPTILRKLGVTGAIVVPGALSPAECARVLSGLLAARIHVHLAPGIPGVDSRRLRSSPMGHEPLLYLEPSGAKAPHYAPLRRGIDLVGATIGLVLTAPVLAVVAVAIKLTDGGPVLFRQERAGKDGRPFMLMKLRSMRVDAEERLEELRELNTREGGPLFKLDADPRVTRVGAILRATSFDEIPQLVNVLKGEMSLVGPRPALVSETHEFDDELMVRQIVRPGVTGLWQVEARDDPSFSSYRYLDMFYVENQSLALDLTILLSTFRAVAASCLRTFRTHREGSPTVATVDAAAVGAAEA